MNAVVFGRMVTFSLQNMRSSVPEFDEWYEGVRERMRRDKVMSFFWDLRTKVEKQAEEHTLAGVEINFNGAVDRKHLGNPPPGAKGFFMGDAQGRSGWDVELEDGTVTQYFVAMPPSVIKRIAVFFNAPEDFGFAKADDLIELYLSKLGQVLDEAEEKFGT